MYSYNAPSQEYTKEFLNELREKELVIYDGKAVHAIKIVPRDNMNPLFEILGEDDGHLFSFEHPVQFDLRWTDDLIKQLNDAKNYWEKIKNNYTKK